jgi:hypothetical protein
MDQYKPVYERERIRAQLSPSLRSKLEAIEDKAAAGGAKKALHDARVKRIRRENYYRSIQGLPLLEVPEIETTERTLLENRQGGNL